MKQTQGRAVIAALKQRPMTYRQMLNLGAGTSPWKRVKEALHADEQIIKGKHHPSDCVTWRVVKVRP
jgi:hypothetical protein